MHVLTPLIYNCFDVATVESGGKVTQKVVSNTESVPWISRRHRIKKKDKKKKDDVLADVWGNLCVCSQTSINTAIKKEISYRNDLVQ